MAKLSLNLDERSLQNGMAQVRIRISHKCTNAFVCTGVYIEPQYFQPCSLYDPVHRKAQCAIDKRERIVEQVERIDKWLEKIEASELNTMTANDIRDRVFRKPVRVANRDTTGVTNKNTVCVATMKPECDFVRWFGEYGDSRAAAKTRKSYEYAWNVLREYCKSLGWVSMKFSDIDYARLSDFARWLRSTGRGESTRHMLESYVRAAYKEAQRRHMVSREHDPYFDYSIKPVPQMDIECLTVEQMRILQSVELAGGMAKARDVAMMSFYLCGANLLDMYEMTSARRCEVAFVRHKTQRSSLRPVRIHIEPELVKLLDVYGGDGSLLHFREMYASYDTFQRRLNRQLYAVSEVVGFDVTMAKIRRTWASIAGSLDVPDRVIDKSMGHVDATVKDKHYEQYDWNRTARANRAVIDAIQNVALK